MAYNISIIQGQALSLSIITTVDVTGYTLTAEFSDKRTFAEVKISKSVSGVGTAAALSLSAAEVKGFGSDFFYRIKGVKDGKTTVVQSGVVDVVPGPAQSAPQAPENVRKVAVWADSMGGDQGNLGVSLWGGLATALGAESFNGTYPGFTSSEVAAIHGGLPIYVTISGNNTIPAGTGAVACTIQPTNSFTATQWINYTGSLAGIPGVLNHNGSNNTYTFRRNAAGTAKVISPETLFVPDTDQRRDWVHIIRLGRNNNGGNVGGDAATIVRDVTAIVKRIPHDRYLVLPIYNGTNFATANTQLAAAFGPNFYDLRGWLSRNGLAVAGIAPTAADTTAMGTGDVPPSLMMDAVHMNAVGRKLEVNRLAELMIARGWFPSFTPLPLT